MKYSFVLFALLFSMLVTSSCTRPQLKLQQEIEKAEAELQTDTMPVPDVSKAEALMGLYLDYAAQFKDDTLSPAYLLKTGELCVAIGRYPDALRYFGMVERYKAFRGAAQAMFLKGFVCENYTHDINAARKNYEAFVAAYPNHPLAADVRVLIGQLGMTPEQLIRQFESAAEVNDSVQ